MAVRQIKSPNVNIGATRGWCLKYVDDAVSAPSRKPTAQSAYNTEKANGNIRTNDLPVGVWVPIFFAITKGAYAGLGHVAWALNRGNGNVEIHDSEVHGGARGPYTSVQQVLNWFGASAGMQYLGWSLWVDGAQIAEEYTPAASAGGALPNQGYKKRSGTAKVLVDSLNVRNDPSNDNAVVAAYSKGDTFNYDGFQINDGFVWLSYVARSGVRRYVAEGPNDGRSDTIWVSGGVA